MTPVSEKNSEIPSRLGRSLWKAILAAAPDLAGSVPGVKAAYKFLLTFLETYRECEVAAQKKTKEENFQAVGDALLSRPRWKWTS